MRSQLGQYIHETRRRQKLSPQALAMRMGYSVRGANKGARRIMALEAEGLEDVDFLWSVVEALCIDAEQVMRLARLDEATRRTKWERWADEPIHPYLVIQYGSHWFHRVGHDLPPSINTLPAAERYAAAWLCREARRVQRTIDGRLVYSRRLTVVFDAEGNVQQREEASYPEVTELPLTVRH